MGFQGGKGWYGGVARILNFFQELDSNGLLENDSKLKIYLYYLSQTKLEGSTSITYWC